MCRVGSNGVRKVSSAVYGSGCVLAVVVAVCPAARHKIFYVYDSTRTTVAVARAIAYFVC